METPLVSERRQIGTFPNRETYFVTVELRPAYAGSGRTVDGYHVGDYLGLSICGELVSPDRRLRDNVISSGQNRETLGELLDTPGATLDYPREELAEILAIWERWHLNGMVAGCSHQTGEGWNTRPIDPNKPLNAYGRHFEGQGQPSWNMFGWIRPDEHPNGLLGKPCPVCGYRYGSAWLVDILPGYVVDTLAAVFGFEVPELGELVTA